MPTTEPTDADIEEIARVILKEIDPEKELGVGRWSNSFRNAARSVLSSPYMERMRADEREACAKEAERIGDQYRETEWLTAQIAAAIRARGTT